MIKGILIITLLVLSAQVCSQQHYDSIKVIGPQDHLVFTCNGMPCSGPAYSNTSSSGQVAIRGTFKDGRGIGEIKFFYVSGVIEEIYLFSKKGELLETSYYDECARLVRNVNWETNTYTKYVNDPTTFEYPIKYVGKYGGKLKGESNGNDKEKKYRLIKGKWVKS